jgi:hypothetical protein
MSNAAALEVLERRLDEIERNGNALRMVINDLRKEDGLPPRPDGGGVGGGIAPANGSGAKLASIKSDTFFGQKMQTAIRGYLNMRRASTGDGPATPREIYDAITAGGYQFEAKEEHTALVGLRALLRKRTAFFIKMPNGKYGLTEWYPDARKPKTAPGAVADADDDGDDDENIDELLGDADEKKGAAA